MKLSRSHALTLFLLSALCSLPSPSRAAHVQFNLSDFTTGPLTNRVVYLQPTNSTPRASGSSIITSDRLTYHTGPTNGSFTASNVVTATYFVTVKGPFLETYFTITVPDTNGLLNAKDLISVNTNAPPGLNAYSMTSSDLRYLIAPTSVPAVPSVLTNSGSGVLGWNTNFSGGGGQSLTNAAPGNAGISVAIINGTLWITNLWSTNGFVGIAITNGLASLAYVNSATNGFVGIAITNGLASITYVNAATNGFVGISITNGLASLVYVNNSTNGFVGIGITNGLASITYVNTSFVPAQSGTATDLSLSNTLSLPISSATWSGTSLIADAQKLDVELISTNDVTFGHATNGLALFSRSCSIYIYGGATNRSVIFPNGWTNQLWGCTQTNTILSNRWTAIYFRLRGDTATAANQTNVWVKLEGQ